MYIINYIKVKTAELKTTNSNEVLVKWFNNIYDDFNEKETKIIWKHISENVRLLHVIQYVHMLFNLKQIIMLIHRHRSIFKISTVHYQSLFSRYIKTSCIIVYNHARCVKSFRYSYNPYYSYAFCFFDNINISPIAVKPIANT